MRTAESVLLMCCPPAPPARGGAVRGAGGGGGAPVGLGGGYALHAVAAGLELEFGIGALADDLGDDFLVAAHFAQAFRQDFHFPALPFGVARIHAEQVAGEQGRLVAAGAGADFQENVAFVVGVLRQQQLLQVDFNLRQLLPGALCLVLGKRFHLRVGQHFLGGFQVQFGLLEALVELDHRRDFGMLAGKAAIVFHVRRSIVAAQALG